MDKKTTQMIIAIITGITGIVSLLALFAAFDLPGMAFAWQSMYIAATVFFLGTCAYMILKIMGNDIAKFVLLAVGVLGTIFAAIFFFDSIGDAFDEDGITYICFALFQLLMPLVVFGLIPLFKGLHKVIGKAEAA